MLGKRGAAARGHGRLLGQPRVQLDEDRSLRLEELGKPSLEIVDVADGGGMPIARGLGHHDEVHREATRNDLSSGGVIDAVLEEEVDQVPGRRARHGGERSELHEERAVPVEHDDAPIGPRERDAQAERGRAAHEAGAGGGEIVGGHGAPSRRRGHGGDADGGTSVRRDQRQHFLGLHSHLVLDKGSGGERRRSSPRPPHRIDRLRAGGLLTRAIHMVSSPTRTAVGPRRCRLSR